MHSTAAVIPKSTPECIDSVIHCPRMACKGADMRRERNVFVFHEDKTRGHFPNFCILSGLAAYNFWG